MALTHHQRLCAGLALAVIAFAAQGASPVHKCVINGSVTFQNSPCPPDKPVRRPTADELNAERRKRLSEAPQKSAVASPAVPSPPSPGPGPAERQAPAAAPRDQGFRCDGRQYCSQMRSCSEARYFLANCPDVKMDGNHDGVPCEQQWCTGPLAR